MWQEKDMFHLRNIFIYLILICTKSEFYNATNISLWVERNDEYDALERKALFEKVNWVIKEVKDIRQEFANFYKRQHNQEMVRRINLENYKSELKEILSQLLIKNENMEVEMKQGLANDFQEQQSFLKDLILSAQNSTYQENIIYKHNRNWQTILRRQDSSLDFNRNWLEYKMGFGNVNGNYFIGLEALHAITKYGDSKELLFILQDFDNKTRYAKYSDFVIGSESEKYVIKEIGSYQGDAGDSFVQHLNSKFSTHDQDNDNTSLSHCAKKFQGGWWFSKCYSSFLTGEYLYQSNTDNQKEKGLVWYSWHGLKYSLKYVEMLIRTKL